VHNQLVIRLVIRYLDKRTISRVRYDISVILLCNTGMPRIEFVVRLLLSSE